MYKVPPGWVSVILVAVVPSRAFPLLRIKSDGARLAFGGLSPAAVVVCWQQCLSAQTQQLCVTEDRHHLNAELSNARSAEAGR